MSRKSTVLLFIALTLLFGCASQTLTLPNSSDNQLTSDKLLIVDCLLPGQIRKLGQQMTYLTARRPIKTTAGDCEIRGGEYVAYDRANYATALNAWLPKAQEGDAEAQAYVGEIYEKGLGTAPNYQLAAEWYRKAAQQGNSRAQINLGLLYEKGWGVEQDLPKAMELYEKSSGLAAHNLSYAATIATAGAGSASQHKMADEITLLKTTLQNSQSEANFLSSQLEKTKQQLIQNNRHLAESKNIVNQTLTQLAQGDASEKSGLEKLLAAKELEIKQEKDKNAALQQRLTQEIGLLTDKLKETEQRANRVRDELAKRPSEENSAAQIKLLEAQANLASTDKRLLELKQVYESKMDLLVADKLAQSTRHEESVKKMEQQLKASKSEHAEQQLLIKQLEQDKANFTQEIDRLKAQPSVRTSTGKPAIEIIEPPFVMTRGKPTVVLRSIVKQKAIIGKAQATAGILNLLVNDEERKIDERGLFNANIFLTGDETPVTVVAVDRHGARASLDFVLSLDKSGKPGQSRSEESGQSAEDRLTWKDLDFGNYHALIIGNKNYEKLPSLDTPINDAQSVEKILREKYGVKTKLLVDANRYQILTELNNYRAKLTEKDNLIIYYAGHGELDKVNMRGHWLPVDADADNSANWISTVAITDILNAMSVKHIMVVADSCYSGAMTRSSLARLESGMSADQKSEWLKAMLKAKSRTVLTSGGLQPVMDGGGGDHSVFAQAVIKALQNHQGLLEGQQLYRDVSANIVAIAASYGIEQVPVYAPIQHAGHESGEFFLVPGI
jgi:TPR repeat protein